MSKNLNYKIEHSIASGHSTLQHEVLLLCSLLAAISQFGVLIGQKMQLTGWHNSNEMRNAICGDTHNSVEWLYFSCRELTFEGAVTSEIPRIRLGQTSLLVNIRRRNDEENRLCQVLYCNIE